MFGFGKNKSLVRAEEVLKRETGLTLSKLPDKQSVEDLFEKLSKQAQLSPEAQVALLYRLVAMNFLGACKLMRDSGEKLSPENLVFVTELTDKSVDWSEKARDHVALESVTSQLNMSILGFLESFGIKRGS